MLLYELVEVSHALAFENLVHGYEDASLLHVAKAIVDGGAKELHSGRERHVGVNERRNVVAQGSHLAVEDEIVLLEVVLAEQLAQLLHGSFNLERLERDDKVVLVVEVLLEEV